MNESSAPQNTPSVTPSGKSGTDSLNCVPKSPSYLFLAVVASLSLVADWVSKAWARNHFEKIPFEKLQSFTDRRVDLFGNRLAFIFAKNRGGAWGILQDASEAIRIPIFIGFSAAAILFILSLFRKHAADHPVLKWGLSLVLGGALGNLVDRIRYGYVVDFIDVRITETYHWPTFNVADISICIGVGLMALDMFFIKHDPKLSGRLDAPADEHPIKS